MDLTYAFSYVLRRLVVSSHCAPAGLALTDLSHQRLLYANTVDRASSSKTYQGPAPNTMTSYRRGTPLRLRNMALFCSIYYRGRSWRLPPAYELECLVSELRRTPATMSKKVSNLNTTVNLTSTGAAWTIEAASRAMMTDNFILANL